MIIFVRLLHQRLKTHVLYNIFAITNKLHIFIFAISFLIENSSDGNMSPFQSFKAQSVLQMSFLL